jgi:superfamily II DNA or RNA helicase
MKERAYQVQAHDAAMERFEAGHQRTLIVLPTGAGKTVVAGFVAKRLIEQNPGKRVMVLAHRDELIRQAADKFATITGIMPEIEKAGERTNEHSMHGPPPVVVASFQTLASQKKSKHGKRRIEKFSPYDFCFLWIDEAHHILADSYLGVARYFSSHPECRVLGVTATPDRGDKQGLGKFFESVAFDYELPDIIADGYLVPIHQYSAVIDGLNLSKVHTVAGDLSAGELERAMMFEKPLHGVVHATLEVACGLEKGTCDEIKDYPDRGERLLECIAFRKRRRTLIFTAGVNQAERMAEILNRWIPGCARHIDGTFPPEVRKKLLRDYANGEFQFLCNCMIATEGFDEPGVELVVMARPTKSRALYSQMVGRGTRPAAEIAHGLGELETADERRAMIAGSIKPHCQVLDFVGNSGRHRLVTTADILGKGRSEEVIALAREKSEAGDVDMTEALNLAAEEVELKKRQAEEAAKKKHEAEMRRKQAEAAKRAGLVGTSDYHLREVDGFDTHSPRVNQINPKLPKSYVKVLRDHKVPDCDIAKFDEATAARVSREVIRHRLAGLCTYKQAKQLMKCGYSRDEIGQITFEKASEFIGKVVANEWRPIPKDPSIISPPKQGAA